MAKRTEHRLLTVQERRYQVRKNLPQPLLTTPHRFKEEGVFLLKNSRLRGIDLYCSFCLANGRGKTAAGTMVFLTPLVRGGKASTRNLVASCLPCAEAKDLWTPEELGWRVFLPFRFHLPENFTKSCYIYRPPQEELTPVLARRFQKVTRLPAPQSLPLLPAGEKACRTRDRSKKVLAQDKYCYYCKSNGRGKVLATTVDHIIPLSRGGKDRVSNMVGCCDPCNSAKGSWLLKELGWALIPPPRVDQRERGLTTGMARKLPLYKPTEPFTGTMVTPLELQQQALKKTLTPQEGATAMVVPARPREEQSLPQY